MRSGKTEDPQEIHRLLRCCSAGDGDAWESLLKDYGGLIYSVIVGLDLSRSEQREVFIYVLEKLWEKEARRLRAWEGRCRFSTYLVTVVSRLCSDYLRARFFREGKSYISLDRCREETGGLPSHASKVGATPKRMYRGVWRGECRAMLEGLIVRLSEEEQSILELFYWQGRRYADVAIIMGLSVNEVGRKLLRVRNKIRNMLLKRGIKNISDLME